jgi:ribose transport system permease protein
VAVIMLGTGTVGLGLVAAPLWAADMFTGVVLIAALGASVYQTRTKRGQTGRFRLPFRRSASA